MPTYTILDIARVAYEANRAYIIATGTTSVTPPTSWEEETDHVSQMTAVQYRFDHPDALPPEQHNAWLATKIDAGWTYGPVKDPVKKEHPCLLPYHMLPPEQRLKDALFCAVVDALKPLIEIEAVPQPPATSPEPVTPDQPAQ